MPLLPMSGADKSTWAARLGAAAEQTKEAPLGLHARDRILQHTWGRLSAPPVHRGRGSGARGHGGLAKAKVGPPSTAVEGASSSAPGHIIVDADFTEVLLGFRVIEAHRPHTAAQQELEGERAGDAKDSSGSGPLREAHWGARPTSVQRARLRGEACLHFSS